MIGRIAMQKDVFALPQHVSMQRQIGAHGAVASPRTDEAAVAIVVPLHEMKIALRVAGDQIVQPADGVLHGLFRRGQRGPAKIKNVATQNERPGPRSRLVNRGQMPGGSRTSRIQMQIGDKERTHRSGQEAEVRGQKSEVGSQRSVVGRQLSEGRLGGAMFDPISPLGWIR